MGMGFGNKSQYYTRFQSFLPVYELDKRLKYYEIAIIDSVTLLRFRSLFPQEIHMLELQRAQMCLIGIFG